MQNATEERTDTAAGAHEDLIRVTTHWVDITARVGSDRPVEEPRQG